MRRALISCLVLALAPCAAARGAPPGGLPDGAPAAAQRAEPVLPRAQGWPFAEAFPRTSGTGRLGGGAAYWTDYLYDDHGARASSGSPSFLGGPAGTYAYPAGPAHNNGADIFRSAVGADAAATYWRVDWTTLADARVPIAEWAIDGDANPATGTSQWAAGAGLRSAGIDYTLVVSAQRATLTTAAGRAVDVTSGLSVDRATRSFVVRVPRSLLPLAGRSRVRLAAGLADPTGTRFAPPASGADPGQPPVFDVGYRSIADEPATYAGNQNPWNDDHQAAALATGDVSAFATTIDWAALAARAQTPEPAPRGASDRWYLSPLRLGDGVRTNVPYGDIAPVYLSQPQPYAVYVPTSWDGRSRLPVTWTLHSSTLNHNQYLSDPNIIQHFCEQRRSLCLSNLGYGPIGFSFDEAEADMWAVWRQAALAYPLDPDRTTLGGYSMGGYAAWKLGLEYPDLFAAGWSLEGPVSCAGGTDSPINGYGQGGKCAADGDTMPLLANARWLPYVVDHSTQDEMVPYETVARQVSALDGLGYRYHFETSAGGDHFTASSFDSYATAATALGEPARTRASGRISYSWYTDLTRADLGIGPTGVYWLRGLAARDVAPGRRATVEADDAALPEAHGVSRAQTPTVASGVPALIQELRWTPAAAPAPRPELSLALTDVGRLAIDTARAGLPAGTVTVTSDGPTTLRLLGLGPAATISAGGRRQPASQPVALGGGTTTVSWR